LSEPPDTEQSNATTSDVLFRVAHALKSLDANQKLDRIGDEFRESAILGDDSCVERTARFHDIA